MSNTLAEELELAEQNYDPNTSPATRFEFLESTARAYLAVELEEHADRLSKRGSAASDWFLGASEYILGAYAYQEAAGE